MRHTHHKPDASRLESFAVAYVPAVLQSATELKVWLGPETYEQYAVSITIQMVAAIERAGVEAIAHYVLNRAALPLTCASLGIGSSIESLDDYLGGR